MSSRPNALLFYGILLKRTGGEFEWEGKYPWSIDEEYEYEYDEVQDAESWCANIDSDGPVDLLSWQASEGAEYAFALITAKHETDWDDILTIPYLHIESDWVWKLKEFCEKADIKYTQPSWHLAAYYW